MASIEKRDRGGKVTWLARWRDETGRQGKRSFNRRIDAQRFITQIEADLLRGQYVDPSDRTTVLEYSRRWAAARIHRPTTARRVASMIDTHIGSLDADIARAVDDGRDDGDDAGGGVVVPFGK